MYKTFSIKIFVNKNASKTQPKKSIDLTFQTEKNGACWTTFHPNLLLVTTGTKLFNDSLNLDHFLLPDFDKSLVFHCSLRFSSRIFYILYSSRWDFLDFSSCSLDFALQKVNFLPKNYFEFSYFCFFSIGSALFCYNCENKSQEKCANNHYLNLRVSCFLQIYFFIN